MRYPDANQRSRTRVDLVVALVLLASGGVVSALQPADQLAISRGLRGTLLLPFLELHRTLAERARQSEQLAHLRAERDSLVGDVVTLRQLATQARQLRSSAVLGPLPADSFVRADLVPGRPRIGDSDVFVLRGAGLREVEAPAGVFTGSGLVGVLRASDGDWGRGEFWTHPEFRVSVRTTQGGTSGIVRAATDADGQPVMLLEGAPFQGEIPPGTELFTTGLAGIYPRGVMVGTVASVSGVESGWAKSYLVRPAARPETADVVLVWRRSRPER